MLANGEVSLTYYVKQNAPQYQWMSLQELIQGQQNGGEGDPPIDWWLTTNFQEIWGPYTISQINAMLANGQTTPSVYVKAAGPNPWTPLQEFYWPVLDQLTSQDQHSTAIPTDSPNMHEAPSPQLRELELRERELELREAEIEEMRKLREENRGQRAEELRARGQEHANKVWEQHMKQQRELGRSRADSFGLMGRSWCHHCGSYRCSCHH
jgi:hypothetical protein